MKTDSYLIGGYATNRSIPTVTDDDAQQLTHLFLAFAVIEDGLVTDRRLTVLDELPRIRAANPDLRILISIGGWGAGGFSELASTAEGRARFVQSSLEIVQRHDLEGIDIDWEYPTYAAAGIGAKREDKHTYTLLMEELRAGLDGLSATRHYELTTAVGADQYYVDGTEMDRVAAVCDWINVMTYDMRGGFQTLTGHHTGLYASTGDLFRISAERSVEMYVAAGVPREKILVGSAFYSRRWTKVPAQNNGLFQMSPGPGLYGQNYTEIARELLTGSEYTRHWDEEAKAPWLWGGDTFISYDDPESIAHKCTFIRERGYAGIFYWEHGCDDTRTLLGAMDAGLSAHTHERDATIGTSTRPGLLVSIRDYSTDDAAAAAALWNACAGERDGTPYAQLDPQQFDETFAVRDQPFAAASFVAIAGERVVGFANGTFTPGESRAYLTVVMVARSYRRRGIGSALLAAVERDLIGMLVANEATTKAPEPEKPTLQVLFFNPITLTWMIPGSPGHDHPNSPGVDLGRSGHLFLKNSGYRDGAYQNSYYLPLAEYELPANITAINKRLASSGLRICRYEPARHIGMDALFDDLGSEDWRRIVQENLSESGSGNPILIVEDGDTVAGFTGPLYVQESGRGYFAGIGVHSAYRGKGAAKALFAGLCSELKSMGATFMSLFTGETNPARNIYEAAGFRIVRSWVNVKKEIRE